MSERGTSIIQAMLAVGLISVGVFFYLQSSLKNRAVDRGSSERVSAQVLATELLELFTSMRPNRLRDYLATNPFNPAKSAYPFCAHINILDPDTGVLLNPDPLADVGSNALGLGEDSSGTRVNRFYQVNVINIQTMQVNRNYCNQTAAMLPPTGLGDHERYFLTVGVTWERQSPSGSEPIRRREVLSTILAENDG